MGVEAGYPVRGPILVTGRNGQVGSELVNSLAPLGRVIAPSRDEMNLINPESIRSTIRSVRPQWIVNPAAYTAVDKAESEPELAYAINAEALKVIGDEARRIGARVIHFSTDYVFDGRGSIPYIETDVPRPLGIYGASKLAGERALAESGAAHMVFRTSWVYGARGRNFLLTILKLARERKELRIVADQHGAPTWSRDLAAMAAHVIRHCAETLDQNEAGRTEDSSVFNGIYHAAGSGETTWHGFAKEAVRLQRKLEPETCFAEIVAISTDEYPVIAIRPESSRLNCKKLEETFGFKMMRWEESLQRVLTELGTASF